MIRRVLLAALLTVGLLLPTVPAQAGVNVIVCNAAVSEDNLYINVVSDYWRYGYPLYRGQCNNFNRAGLYVHIFYPVTSWRVRTNPGTYGAWQTKQFSTPGSHDRYEYQVRS